MAIVDTEPVQETYPRHAWADEPAVHEEQAAQTLDLRREDAIFAKKVLEFYGENDSLMSTEARDKVKQAEQVAHAIMWREVRADKDIMIPLRAAGVTTSRADLLVQRADLRSLEHLPAAVESADAEYTADQREILANALSFYAAKNAGSAGSSETTAALDYLHRHALSGDNIGPKDEELEIRFGDESPYQELLAGTRPTQEDRLAQKQRNLEGSNLYADTHQQYPSLSMNDDEYRAMITQRNKRIRQEERRQRLAVQK